MSLKSFSAARANLILESPSPRGTWEQLTVMFKGEASPLIPHYPLLKEVENRESSPVSKGMHFQYTRRSNDQIFAQVTECDVCRAFAFVASPSGHYQYQMHFEITDSGLAVEHIAAADAGILPAVLRWHNDTAKRLQHVITGEQWKRKETQRGPVTIVSDKDLCRKGFPIIERKELMP